MNKNFEASYDNQDIMKRILHIKYAYQKDIITGIRLSDMVCISE